ncbi:unnamed protein product [Pleuronectes platessa]|uniref:G-protein coupled receptors family 3 profile domain-containing protein n=1 Tax=Pleuronectes platessa TaxID=8262 RepID=A0A9N7VHM9_PLEPL|nr:unnamed protein product [Pleuronectes platessa]
MSLRFSVFAANASGSSSLSQGQFLCDVGILYFQPSVFRCILLRWVRLLGFATVYGTLTLKLYRWMCQKGPVKTVIKRMWLMRAEVLKVFLSRTAQRIPYMTSWRVLRLLGIILLIVCWFLVAWTSAVCQNPDRKSTLIDVSYTPDGLQFSMCLLDRWDYMMAVAEFLFLLWAVYLCYAVRTVPSAFHEPRYMAIAVHSELVLSAVFHVIRPGDLIPRWPVTAPRLAVVVVRFWYKVQVRMGCREKMTAASLRGVFTLAPELHPDWMLLLFFTHTHLTVTVTLGLLLIPKFLFAGAHMRDDIASEAYEDELDMGRSGSYLNSSITSAWSEHSLDPEDIREELKKLYSQLEIYKRKKMLANNPHLQKKRSSKKGLGREDKELGDHGSNRNSICMLKKNPFDPPHPGKPAKEETLKNKVFSLKKSHSSYDHVRDQNEDSNSSTTDKMEVTPAEGSLLEALMGKKLVKKKSSENVSVPSDSTECVPLVCKSASAHNLTADKKPLHPKASMLQKSLSVIASAKEKTLGLTTGKAPSAEDNIRRVSQSAKRRGPVQSQKTKALKGKDLYDLSEVCPWEVEDVPTPTENKVQKHVSIAPKETTTVHGGSTKGGKSQQKQKASDHSSGRNSKEIQKTTAVRAEVCPWEDGVESSKKARVDVCPWDFEEPQTTTEVSRSSDATKQKKGTSPVDSRGKSILSDPSKVGGSLQPPTKADVCPWDYDSTAVSPNSERTPSPSQVAKTKEDLSKKKATPSTRTLEKEKSRDTDDEKSRTKSKDKSKSSERHAIPQKLAEVCPWDVESQQEVPLVEKRKSANVGAAKPKPAEVCPWEFEDTSANKGTDKSASVVKQSIPNAKGGVEAVAKKADVCPWDFEESTSSKQA